MANLVAVAAICLGISAFGIAEPQCHMSELFTCFDKPVDFLNALPRRTLPTTNDEVEKLCKALNEGLTCIEDYRNRCMTPIQRELLSLSSEGIVDLRDKFCSSPASQVRTDYLTNVECLNKVMQGEGTNNNLQYLLAVTERLSTLPNSERLNYLCCGYSKMYHDLVSETSSTCGEETAESGKQFVNLAVAQLPNMLCSGYDGNSAGCLKVLPPEGTKPTDEFKDSPIYTFFYNLVKNYLE